MKEGEKIRPKLLLVDDDETLLRLMSIRLKGEGFDVTSVNNATHALRLTYNNVYDVVLSDLRMPGMDGLNLFDEILQKHRDLPLILMTAHGNIKDAIAATQRGVYSFLTKPVDHAELRKTLLKAIAQTNRQEMGDWCADIITRSPEMITLLRQAEQVADKNVSVLISGASGTGKELLAKAVHNASDRKTYPFVSIKCGALPESIFEAELFGEVTENTDGTYKRTDGLFAKASGGTLFLDEISDMPTNLQIKLLQALQEKTIQPVGSNDTVAIDVRVISATHKDLNEAVQLGEFREDLFYRLNVVNLSVPLLKDRFEDIPILAEHLLKQSAKKHGLNVIKFADEAITLMTKFDWPGNVRQLVNVVERCVALTTTQVVPSSLVEQALSQESQYWPTLTEARDTFEYEYLCRLLQLTEGNVTRASDLAGRNRTDLHKLMKKHRLVAAEFRNS
ncbi:MAG: sigma 54-interacting transcriptional regulator [Glaciecola sp.]